MNESAEDRQASVGTAAPVDEAVAIGRAALWKKRIAKERTLGVDEGDEFAFHHAGWTVLFTAAACGLRSTGLWKRGRRNACDIQLDRETLRFPGLHADLVGLRILHLSDFHFNSRDRRHQDAVLAALDGIEADLCLMTGDFRFGHYGPSGHVYPIMQRLLAGLVLRHPPFAVLGNHDTAAMIPGLEALGLRVLMNEGALLYHGTAPVWIAGTDDPHKYRAASVELALDRAPAEAFKIALVHAPECIPEAAAGGVSLYLSGHTHAGQICLPWWGPVRLNARCERVYTIGRWRYGTMEGHTSAGLGNTDLAVRFNAPPRATLFTLAAGEAEAQHR